ncbi:MAG: NAD(P)H-binding protein [Conexibacter sp.]
MARVLIVGCGCRGQALARALREQGHAVRGTTRDESRRAAIESAGAEVWIGDPDRIATISYALADVTILCWLMGSASGPAEKLEALHGSRLRMLLERTIDTTVRGLLYEAAGTVEPALLAEGAQTVHAACEKSEIPHALLDADPADHDAWLAAALREIEGLLAYERPGAA